VASRMSVVKSFAPMSMAPPPHAFLFLIAVR
jgi:hypothetical protein